MEKEIYSLCFMCSVRCPIKVYVKDGQVNFIEGNPHVAGMEGSRRQSTCGRHGGEPVPQRIRRDLVAL